MSHQKSRRQSIPTILSLKEASRLSLIPVGTLRNLCKSKRIAAINVSSKISRHEYRIPASILLNFLTQLDMQSPQELKDLALQQENQSPPAENNAETQPILTKTPKTSETLPQNIA